MELEKPNVDVTEWIKAIWVAINDLRTDSKRHENDIGNHEAAIHDHGLHIHELRTLVDSLVVENKRQARQIELLQKSLGPGVYNEYLPKEND